MYIHMYVTFGICLIKIWEIAMTPSRTTVASESGLGLFVLSKYLILNKLPIFYVAQIKVKERSVL